MILFQADLPRAVSGFGLPHWRSGRRSVFLFVMSVCCITVLLHSPAVGTPVSAAAGSLKVAVAQMGLAATPQENLLKISQFIRQASLQSCRVVVFPEGALREVREPNHPDTVALVNAIRQDAADHQIYAIVGVWSRSSGARGFNWMFVVDPSGQEIFRYEKLYDHVNAPMPGVFFIDGIPCNAFLCADRWLRGVSELPVMDGAQISFELSLNLQSEWEAPLEWYWYISRAIRNNVYVVVSNTAVSPTEWDHHGHSAVVAPDGAIVASTDSEIEELLVADLDLTQATRAEAERRRTHPIFAEFWDVGRRIRDGETVSVPSWTRYSSPAVSIKMASAQMAVTLDMDTNLATMKRMVAQAAGQNADVVIFPELAVTSADRSAIQAVGLTDLEAALQSLQAQAIEHGIYVIFGMPALTRIGTSECYRRTNAAYVISPDGSLLTRYDQMVVERSDLFETGYCPTSMWFKIKGAWAVVTLGREVLWSEISEMAAYAGTQLLFNLSNRPEAGGAADLRRNQVGINFASFFTFSGLVNAAAPGGGGGSAIWDDLLGYEEMRAAADHASPPDSGPVHIYVDFAANSVVQAEASEQIVYATRTVNEQNPFREDSKNPQMRPWYRFGAHMITGCLESSRPAQAAGANSVVCAPLRDIRTRDRRDQTGGCSEQRLERGRPSRCEGT